MSDPNKFWVVRKTGRGEDLVIIQKIRDLNRIETLFIKGLNQQKTFKLVFWYVLDCKDLGHNFDVVTIINILTFYITKSTPLSRTWLNFLADQHRCP